VGLVDGKVVLITGAATGIGRAGAELFAREGAAQLYLVDVNDAGLRETVDRVEAAGVAVRAVCADVTDEGALRGVVAAAVADHGRLDCAWNNAGVGDASRPFTEVDRASWDRMIAINLTGVFVCMQAELTQMEVQGYGTIVNTASVSGLVATAGMPHYTAAKHGVIGLTKVAALDYNDRNIRVNAVCPGMVDTALVHDLFDTNPRLAAAIQRRMPGGKMGQPMQVAEAVVWLSSERADWVSGLSMVLDGGGLNR
jgi:NAD(P)-dependent dehydrogenase (short-subunit alcohol dehydrogenase family)